MEVLLLVLLAADGLIRIVFCKRERPVGEEGGPPPSCNKLDAELEGDSWGATNSDVPLETGLNVDSTGSGGVRGSSRMGVVEGSGSVDASDFLKALIAWMAAHFRESSGSRNVSLGSNATNHVSEELLFGVHTLCTCDRGFAKLPAK